MSNGLYQLAICSKDSRTSITIEGKLDEVLQKEGFKQNGTYNTTEKYDPVELFDKIIKHEKELPSQDRSWLNSMYKHVIDPIKAMKQARPDQKQTEPTVYIQFEK